MYKADPQNSNESRFKTQVSRNQHSWIFIAKKDFKRSIHLLEKYWWPNHSHVQQFAWTDSVHMQYNLCEVWVKVFRRWKRTKKRFFILNFGKLTPYFCTKSICSAIKMFLFLVHHVSRYVLHSSHAWRDWKLIIVSIGNSMICSDIWHKYHKWFLKLLYVISRAVRQVKFETILKYRKWYLCQISHTNRAIICLSYCPQKVCNFQM